MMGRYTSRRSRLTTFVIVFVGLTATSHAAEESATGVWAWTYNRDGQVVRAVVELKQRGETLTGTVRGARGNEAEIHDGKLGKDGELSFTVERAWNGKPFVVRYRGELVGDSIRGRVETTYDGGRVGRDWKATRITGETPLPRPRTTPSSGTTGREGGLPPGNS